MEQLTTKLTEEQREFIKMYIRTDMDPNCTREVAREGVTCWGLAETMHAEMDISLEQARVFAGLYFALYYGKEYGQRSVRLTRTCSSFSQALRVERIPAK